LTEGEAMDVTKLVQRTENAWEIPRTGAMRVPGVIYASRALVAEMDDKVAEQVRNVATLPGIVRASYAMPDAHWGYGFAIGGVAAFEPDQGVVSAGGVGFDISCGVRCLTTGLCVEDVAPRARELAERLYATIPAGVGSEGKLRLSDRELDLMLAGGAKWAVERGFGEARDLERIEEGGCMQGARPECVSQHAKDRQRGEVGTLGSGNHYLEVQRVAEVCDGAAARAFGLALDDVVVSIHCGSRGLGHQIGTDFLKKMLAGAKEHGIELPDRELACAPIRSAVGTEYLGAMRAAINCALANREVLTHLTREVFAGLFPSARLDLVYDVSHNTCKEEEHALGGARRTLFVHRKGATRAFGPGNPALPTALRDVGQPVLIGGSMGTGSWVLVGTKESETRAFSSACHGAGRNMSRNAALKLWRGRQVIDDLARQGIYVKSPSMRGVAEEAPGAYKDVGAVVDAADAAQLARKVARLVPIACVKG
jgi:tRNA-splicing ligase RtcB